MCITCLCVQVTLGCGVIVYYWSKYFFNIVGSGDSFEPTKSILGKVGVFSVSSLHAMVSETEYVTMKHQRCDASGRSRQQIHAWTAASMKASRQQIHAWTAAGLKASTPCKQSRCLKACSYSSYMYTVAEIQAVVQKIQAVVCWSNADHISWAWLQWAS